MKDNNASRQIVPGRIPTRLKLTGLAILCSVGLCDRCMAITREWVAGATDSHNWSAPGNWNPAGVPQDGDDLVFHDTPEIVFPHMNMVNDLVGLRINSLQFCGTASGPHQPGWSLEGNELTLLSEVDRTNLPPNECGPSSFIFNCPLKLGGPVRIGIGWGFILLRGNIDLNGNELTLESGDEIAVSGQITGVGNVVAVIDGYVRESSIVFDGPSGNTFSGKLTVSQIHSEIGRVVFDKQTGAVVNDALLIGLDPDFPWAMWPICQLARPHQIGDKAKVCLTNGGQLLLDGHTETIGSLSLTNRTRDLSPSLVDTGGATLSVLTGITAVNDSMNVVPAIRGRLGLPGTLAASAGADVGAAPAKVTVGK